MERFFSGEQSLTEFLSDLGVGPEDVPPQLSAVIARWEIDSDVVWAWCQAAELFGRSLRLVPVLCYLLECDDHESHEDIANMLQNLRDPRSVGALYNRAIRPLSYLEYNESTALARKCVWALHDIGTPGAREKLKLLTGDKREVVAGSARKKLAELASQQSNDGDRPYRIARNNRLGPL